MNSTCITGNLARDPEVKVLPSGSIVTNLVVATSRYFTRRDGVKDKETAFVPCEAWDTAAQFIGANFNKGDPILIHGALKENRWEKDGKNHSRLILRIGEFNKLERRKPKTQPSSSNSVDTANVEAVEAVKAVETVETNDGQIPF